jgi:glycosyltransferase involved in cell wall biosynthesis
LSHEGQIVGAIANAYPAKDLPTLLTAFNLLASKIPAVSLVICGDGPEMPRIHIIRDSLSNGKRIYLPGAVRDASRLLKGFDVFTLSSTKEGLPWVILEASLAETPIVATSVGAIPELIENRVNGLLVPPSDPVALSTAIYETLTNAELHKKLKSGVTRVAERRSGSGMVEKTLALYRSISRHS